MKRPCGSCPYRKDVPSGVWAEAEYDQLPRFDGPIHEQSTSIFMCHQQDGELCSGWVGCHDMQNTLGMRLAVYQGTLTPDQVQEALDYECPVPLWESGQAARDHGVAEIKTPSDKAIKIVKKLERKLGDGISYG